MWMYVDYEPVSAFGLRPSNTTSNGGKSLISPTPYAVKMALLDRIIRLHGLVVGETLFPILRDMQIFFRLPLAISVNRTFQKVLRGYDRKTRQWTSTIVQREYVFYAGHFSIAMPAPEGNALRLMLEGFAAINYFGRRGSFFQLIESAISEDEPTWQSGFINVSQQSSNTIMGFLQRMDDMESWAAFSDVSNFNSKANGARRSYTVIFPYMLDHHGMNHTVYLRSTL